ncbi:group I truncated hemoglobin [Marinifilum fragile]|uniref:group I truncated hemoglobin n=1 Tax=Marinifilum fragile TaxID=570161 RepID=UPI0006D0B1EB|nr:group 1 truncated hemoglobin [Marinifilum fragile]
MELSLYERLGGSDGITKIASDTVDLHLKNAAISTRFSKSDITTLKKSAANFFIMGTGGPSVYEGKDMLSTHKGMNISDVEFNAVLDDILQALEMNDVGQKEKEEVLFVLYGMKKEIVAV